MAGCELVATAALDPRTGAEGSVQVQLVGGTSAAPTGLAQSTVTVAVADGVWTGDNRRFTYGAPILVTEGSAARKRLQSACDDFRQLFPTALCYTTIVPVDEVVTLNLLYREDNQLVRLMLDDAQHAELDRLWDQLRYINQDALTMVDAFSQLMEYATQDADPKVFEGASCASRSTPAPPPSGNCCSTLSPSTCRRSSTLRAAPTAAP